MIYKTINYLKDNQTIETYLIDGEIWLSKKAMSLLYKKTVMTISNYVQKIGFCGPRFKKYLIVNKNNKTTLYDVNTVLEIGKMLGYYDMSDFENWVWEKLNYVNDGKYEIVRFDEENIQLDVTVSPSEETVWLSQFELSVLFDATQSNISKHIKNIFDSKELEIKSVYSIFSYTATDGKNYSIGRYNLDIIIALGYRINSKRAILFRKWATNTLKQFLLKGYVINKNRSVVTYENFSQLEQEVQSIKGDVEIIKENILLESIKEKIFYKGEVFDAHELLCSIFASAKKTIILIDPYFDVKGLKMLEKRKDGVEINVYLSKSSKLNDLDINRYERQYGKVRVTKINDFHDRFIIIDNSECYSIGTSLNYLGNKIFSLHRIEAVVVTQSIISYLNNLR